KQHGSMEADSPEKESILGDLVAAGFAKKVGSAYVYNRDKIGLIFLGICGLLSLAIITALVVFTLKGDDSTSLTPGKGDAYISEASAKQKNEPKRPVNPPMQLPPSEPSHSTAARPQTPQEIVKSAFASTVFLVMEDSNGQPLRFGSGFFVREGELATNLH